MPHIKNSKTNQNKTNGKTVIDLGKTTFFLGIAIIFFFLSMLPIWGSTPGQGQGNRVEVEITGNLKEHLATLPADEKDEQMRDWVVLSYMKNLDVDAQTKFAALYDFTPLRKDFLESVSNYKHGESRSIILKSGELIVFVPYDSPKKDVYIARHSDEYRMVYGAKPSKAIIIEYWKDSGNSPSAGFIQRQILNQEELFSEKMGYYESNIYTKEQLESFLSKIDDLAFVGLGGNQNLTLGGRKFKDFPIMGINLEDLAVLYQAYDDFMAFFEEYHIGFSLDPQIDFEKFGNELNHLAAGDENYIRQWFDNYEKPYLIEEFKLDMKTRAENCLKLFSTSEKSGNMGEISLITLLYGSKSLGEEKKELFERSINDSLAAKYNLTDEDLQENLETHFENLCSTLEKNRDILMEIAKEISVKKIGLYLDVRRYLEGKNSIDLSLKRKIQTPLDKMILRDVLDMLYEKEYLETKEKEVFDNDVTSAIKTFQENNNLPVNGIVDNETYMKLLSNFDSYEKEIELSHLNAVLNSLKYLCSYQKARYDGNINGTEVGMTLFYTDLTMKIWGIDRENSAPESAIDGFKAMANYAMNYCFREEESKNPSTRFWLGPLESGYEFNNSKNQLFFAPIITRVFCKSSDGLSQYKKDEVDAKPSSARFAGWWNNHYSEIADYEPQYHRLNQIMKWTAVFDWLKDQNQFEYLKGMQCKRDLDFQQWYNKKKEQNEFSAAVDIPFLDKTKLGETTECIELLRSRQFVDFADYDKNNFDYSSYIGGVTLNPKLINKVGIPNEVIVENRIAKPGVIFERSTTLDNIAMENGATFKVNLPSNTASIKNTTGKFRTPSSEFKNLPISRSIKSNARIMEMKDETSGLKVNELLATQDENKILLSSPKSDLSIPQKLLKQVNNDPSQIEQILDSTDDIIRPIKTGEGKYAAQLKETGDWIEIKITNKKLSKGYDITMSNSQTNQNLAFIANKNRDKIFANDTWVYIDKTNKNKIPELVFKSPSPDEIKSTIYFSEQGLPRTQGILTENGIYFKNSLPNTKNNLELTEILRTRTGSTINALHNEFINGQNVNVLIYKNDGKLLQITNGKSLSPENLKLFKEMVPDGNLNLKGIVFKEGETSIRMIDEDILCIPSYCTAEQKGIISSIMGKISRNKEWGKILKDADKIDFDYCHFLNNLDESNLKLAQSYSQFKSVKNLPPDQVLVDISSSRSKSQMLVKMGNSEPKIVNMEKQFSQGIDEINETTKNLYAVENELINEEQLKRLWEPVKEMLEKAQIETNAGTIIIKCPSHINPQLVAKIFKLEGRFIKDQPNMNKSVRNAQMEIIPKIDETIFLSSIPLEDSNFDEIGQVYKEMIDSSLIVSSNLNMFSFFEYLSDEEITQLILVVRATEKGLVFSDRTVSFEEMNQLLQKIQKEKELLYIISNEANYLQEFFAASGKFHCVVSSGYTEGDEFSFLLTLQLLREFYPGITENGNITMEHHFDQKPTLIPIVFPAATAQEEIIQKTYGIKDSVWNIINRLNEKVIELFRNTPNITTAPTTGETKPISRLLKAIPTFKVQNLRVNKRRNYFGNFNPDYRAFA